MRPEPAEAYHTAAQACVWGKGKQDACVYMIPFPCLQHSACVYLLSTASIP